MVTGWLFISFVFLLLFSIPIAFSLGISSIAFFLFKQDVSLMVIAQRMVNGLDSFPLLAVPFFILVGELMNTSSVTSRIFSFANSIVGFIPGGLGHVNVLNSMIFAGMSGAAVADAAGIGRVEIKAMNEQGFDNEFSAAVTAASSTIGPIIPPSIPMVIFGMVANVSIPALFIGGILPGILMGISMMVVVYIVSVRRHYPRSDRFSMRLVKTTFLKALPSLMTPVILIGGILGGVFTPTEAAAVAVVYALFLGCLIYRDIPIAELGEIIFRTSISTAIILIIISTAAVIGLFVAREQVPQKLVVSLSSISKNPIIILLSINIMLLFLGCFLDTTAIIVILTPILLPVIKMFGIDPVHFGVLMILNLMIGLLTPPFGLIMFVICDICKISVFQFTKATLPFIIILLVTLFLVTYIPEIVLFLPRLLIK